MSDRDWEKEAEQVTERIGEIHDCTEAEFNTITALIAAALRDAAASIPYSNEPFPNQQFGYDGPYIHSPLCQGNSRAAVRRACALSVVKHCVKNGWKSDYDQYIEGCEDSAIIGALQVVRDAAAQQDAQLQAERDLRRLSNASVMDGLRRIARALGDDEPQDLGAVHVLASLIEYAVSKAARPAPITDGDWEKEAERLADEFYVRPFFGNRDTFVERVAVLLRDAAARPSITFIPPEDYDGERCRECGLAYSNFIYRLPDHLWVPLAANQTLLCPICIINRAIAAGWTLYWEAELDHFPTEGRPAPITEIGEAVPALAKLSALQSVQCFHCGDRLNAPQSESMQEQFLENYRRYEANEITHNDLANERAKYWKKGICPECGDARAALEASKVPAAPATVEGTWQWALAMIKMGATVHHGNSPRIREQECGGGYFLAFDQEQSWFWQPIMEDFDATDWQIAAPPEGAK